MEDKELKLGQENVKAGTSDFKKLYGDLRNKINNSVDNFKKSLAETKDAIEQQEEKLRVLKIRKERLEGAIEAGNSFLTSVLPSNNKQKNVKSN